MLAAFAKMKLGGGHVYPAVSRSALRCELFPLAGWLLGFHKKFIVKGRDAGIVDWGLVQLPRFLVGQSAGIVGVGPVMDHGRHWPGLLSSGRRPC
jgi:hypothetical protein